MEDAANPPSARRSGRQERLGRKVSSRTWQPSRSAPRRSEAVKLAPCRRPWAGGPSSRRAAELGVDPGHRVAVPERAALHRGWVTTIATYTAPSWVAAPERAALHRGTSI